MFHIQPYDSLVVLGWNIFAFDLFILLMTLCFAIFCRQARESSSQK